MWGYLLTITSFLLQIGALHAQADSSSVVIERFPDGAIHRKYHVIVTEVVDTVMTEAMDGSTWNMVISSSMMRCPSGPFIEFDRHGFVVAKGDLLYTYGAACRTGTWQFFISDKLIRTEHYLEPGFACFEEDPHCQIAQ
jgi:hypothetical protein